MGGIKITENKEIKKKAWSVNVLTLLFLIGVIIIAFGTIYFFKFSTAVNWLLILIIMAIFFGFLGYLVKGRMLGILIDERNEMSLSRFQLVLWTLIILSAFFAIGLSRIIQPFNGDITLALDIGVPEQIWVLLGISTISLVGSPLILSRKKLSNPDEEKLIDANINLEDKLNEKNMVNIGTVVKRNDPNEASFFDIFTGDEILGSGSVNMAKLQMFFFTIIILIVYCVLLLDLMTKPEPITGFPELSTGLIALLAISHGGYLTEKSIPSTPTTP
ncbi:MAG: hypothetical protein ACXVHY_11130 [Methanobacterium sp.]